MRPDLDHGYAPDEPRTHTTDTPRITAESLSVSPTRRTFLTTVALGVGAVSGCLGSNRSDDYRSVTYRHRFDRSGIGSAVYDGGVELGSWEAHELDVEFKISSGSRAAAQSVDGGQDDFANAEIAAVLSLIDAGAPLTILAQETTPMGGVITLRETGISSWTDLAGVEVGRFPWGVTGQLAEAAITSEGGDPNAVEWRNVEPGAHIQLLLEGAIDGAVAYYPQAVTRLELAGHETQVLPLGTVLDHLGNALITRQEIVDEHPEVVERFVRGWLDAHDTFISRTDDVIDVHRDLVPNFDETVEREVLPLILASRIAPETDLESGMGWTPIERMTNTLDILEQIDMLSSADTPETYFTNRFIEESQDRAIDIAERYAQTLEQDYDIEPTAV